MLNQLANLEYWLTEGFWNEYGDPRLNGYGFMASFRLGLFILALWSLFVFYLGPRFMRHRKPYSLKTILLIYNSTMASFNGFIFIKLICNYRELFPRMIDTKFPDLTDTSGQNMELIWFNQLYVMSKFVDLLDTVFFVLRKKHSQITALHLYHHSSVAFFGWITFRLCAICNVGAPFVFMNSFIHVLMYSYYALAALGPSMQKYLWWKRYITQIQIVQFILLFIHVVYFLCTQQGFTIYYKVNYCFNTVVYLVLFSRFYLQTYWGKRGKEIVKLCDANQNYEKKDLKIE